MKRIVPVVLLLLIFGAALSAGEDEEALAPDLRGTYIYSSDVYTVSTPYAAMVSAALALPGSDGIVLVAGWNALEPAKGQYDWSKFDSWMSAAASAGKKVELAVTAGDDTPPWVFQPVAAGGAGATPIAFTVSPHAGQTGKCDSETIAAPWDPAFLSRWDSLLAALSSHLKSAGTYGAVTLLRLTGINRTTDELRLPAETPQATGLPCVSDAVATWQQAGYRPSLLLEGWDSVTASFAKSFPDKPFSVAIIAQNAFPRIAEDGSIIRGTVPDQDLPLLTLASQRFPGRLVIQYNFLMPGEAANSAVIGYAQTLGTLIAFQTNEYLGSTGQGAACSEPVTNPAPCTAATFLAMLETGIYPLGPSNALRAQYIEVFPANAVAFPADTLQAHEELLLASRSVVPLSRKEPPPVRVPFHR
jgi:glycosyl hydrolase family 42 (putative beta-galactosidase)